MLTNLNDIDTGRIKVMPVTIPELTNRSIQTDILRTDLIHPVISGNKWFKLRYYLEEAREKGIKKLVTFGGAWSNHIHASAATARLYEFSVTGLIRGEKPAIFSSSLDDAVRLGMELRFVSREAYKNKIIPEDLLTEPHLLIPEGGYGITGAKGASTITDFFDPDAYTHICCAVGTGTMMAGLLNSCKAGQHITGISVMKNNYSLEQAVTDLLSQPAQKFSIEHRFHFGGYAKKTTELIAFMNRLYLETGIPTDFVYTGKMCFAASKLAAENYFPPGSKLLLIHSGGLQGNRSLEKGSLIF